MRFGEYLSERRKGMDMKIKDFANLVNVDASSISRIENHRVQATLSVVIRIIDAISISPAAFFAALQEKSSDAIEELRVAGSPNIAVGQDDCRNLLSLPVDHGHTVLAAIANQIAPEQIRLDEASIRLMLATAPFFVLTLKYPSGADKAISAGYLSGGVVTLSDVGAFMRGQRKAGKGFLHGSQSFLSEIERGAVSGIKLADIVRFDDELEAQGRLFLMFWSAMKFRDEVDEVRGGINVVRRMELFVFLTRWLQTIHSDDTTWLSELRRELHPGMVSDVQISE